MKKLVSLLLVISILLSFAPIVFALDDIPVYLNGEKIDKAGIIVADRTYLPVRSLCEALGYTVDWIDGTKSVIIGIAPDTTKKTDKVNIYLDGTLLENTEAIIIDSTTYLPVRALCEALGMEVTWDAEKREVHIAQKLNLEYPIDEIVSSDGFKLLDANQKERFLAYTSNSLPIGNAIRAKIETTYIDTYQTLSASEQKDMLIQILSETASHQTSSLGPVDPEGEKASYKILNKSYQSSYDVWRGEFKPVWIYSVEMESGYENVTHNWQMISAVEDSSVVTDAIEAMSRYPYGARKFVNRIIYDPDPSNTYYGGGNSLWMRMSWIPTETQLAKGLGCVLGYVLDANTTTDKSVWDAAIENDVVPVSGFGKTNRVSDLGEFNCLYHVVKNMENGLSELEKIYPNRFAAYASMLYVADPIHYADYRCFYEATLGFDDGKDALYYQILLPGTNLVLTANDPTKPGSAVTFEENTNVDNQIWQIREHQGEKVILNKASGLCLNVPSASVDNGKALILWSYGARNGEKLTMTNIANDTYTLVFSHSNLFLGSAGSNPGCRAIQTTARTNLVITPVE